MTAGREASGPWHRLFTCSLTSDAEMWRDSKNSRIDAIVERNDCTSEERDGGVEGEVGEEGAQQESGKAEETTLGVPAFAGVSTDGLQRVYGHDGTPLVSGAPNGL